MGKPQTPEMRIAFVSIGSAHAYSRFRDQAATVAELAISLKANQVDVWGIGRPDRLFVSEEVLRLTQTDWSRENEEIHMFRLYLSARGIHVDVKETDKDSCGFSRQGLPPYDLVVFGGLSGTRAEVQKAFAFWLELVETARGYVYLDTNQELGQKAQKKPRGTTFASALRELDASHEFRRKLKVWVCTEPPDRSYFRRAEAAVRCPVVYCPIVDYANAADYERISLELKDVEKTHDMVFFKNFRAWVGHEEFRRNFISPMLDEIRKVVWYDASPRAQAVFDVESDPTGELRVGYSSEDRSWYGIEHRPARSWSRSEVDSILRPFRLCSGIEKPDANRFTFKVIEAVQAGTLTLIPDLNPVLSELPVETQKVYLRYTEGSVYQHLLKVDYLATGSRSGFGRSMRQSLLSVLAMNPQEYAKALEEQQLFLRSFFSAEAHHVVNRIADLARACR